MVFRRTFPEITNAGGLWDESGRLYPGTGGRAVRGELEWRWPQNVRIPFRHLEHVESVYSYQGTEVCYLAFDELTHLAESQFWYMLSRNRSTCGIRPYVRATCNPHPGWVKSLLAPWVDDAYAGRPASSGEIRWFKRVDGKIKWLESPEEDAKSITFIRASIYDNPILLRANPEYLANLKALPPVEQSRLLRGDWNARRDGLVYPHFESCVVDHAIQATVPPTLGGVDFGFRNPFCAVWGFLDHDDCLWITGMRYKSQTSLPEHSAALPEGVCWWGDPAAPQEIFELRLGGHDIRPCVHLPTRGAGGEVRSPRMSGIDSLNERMSTGRLKIIRQSCKPLVNELGFYHYDPERETEEPVKQDDHACDALRYLCVGMSRGRRVELLRDHEERLRKEAQRGENPAAFEGQWYDDPRLWESY
jgi:hypothetical protein